MALACHNYHDIHKSFPAGQIVSSTPGLADGHGWAWSAFILPQMEQSAIHDQIDFRLAMADPLNIDVVRIRLATFECPSDATLPTDGVPSAQNGQFLISNPGIAPSSYVGNAGAFENPDSPFFPQTADELARRNGVLMRTTTVQMRDITDGTSNTILLGESIHYNFWPAGWDPKLYGCTRSTDMRFAAVLALARVGLQRINPPLTASNVVKRESFSSYHPGGSMFALCDGSVRFISETIHHTGHNYAQWLNDRNGLGTFQRLTARNDGLPVSEF